MDRYNSECHGWSAGVNYTFLRYLLIFEQGGDTDYYAILQIPEGVACVHGQKLYGFWAHFLRFQGGVS